MSETPRTDEAEIACRKRDITITQFVQFARNLEVELLEEKKKTQLLESEIRRSEADAADALKWREHVAKQS